MAQGPMGRRVVMLEDKQVTLCSLTPMRVDISIISSKWATARAEMLGACT